MKFKIGDYIKGTKLGNTEYTYTDEHMTKGVVIGIDDYEDDVVTIRILEHDCYDNCIGYEFEVVVRYFAPYVQEQKDNRDKEYTWCPKNEHVRKVVDSLLKSVQVDYALDHNDKKLFEQVTNEYD